MARIGIFGGTFDPVHLGHLMTAEKCLEQGDLDQVVFVPAASPPHKQNQPVTDFSKRVEMLKLATAGQPAFSVSETEKERGGLSYTVDTLEEMKRQNPDAELSLIVGSDSLNDLPNWRNPRRILELASLLVTVRPGQQPITPQELREKIGLPPEAPLRVNVVQSPPLDIASRNLRQMTAEGKPLDRLVPKGVENYIKGNKLYNGAPQSAPVRQVAPAPMPASVSAPAPQPVTRSISGPCKQGQTHKQTGCTPIGLAIWTGNIINQCLLEAGGDIEAALSAADYIVSTQPLPDELPAPVDLNAFFAHDIHNRQAQGILNRSIQAARGLSSSAKKELAAALKQGARDSGQAILEFINKYRLQLAKLLTTTQLASLLEGAREVAAKVPPLGVVPITGLPVSEQERIAALAPLSKFTPPAPKPGSIEDIHFPTIDEAVKELAEKNVMTRDQYDALDAAARAKAFTVANIQAEETLTKIRDSLAENVQAGADYETWKQEVLADVDEGTFMSDAHQETVFRTNVQGAFSDGQMKVLNHPLVRSGFPYSAYDAIHDDRVRENHLALEKLGIDGSNVYRNDDPVFQLFRPPWDYNDRCSWTPMTVRQAASRGIKEAQQWLDTGVEPSPPAFVDMPDFEPPPGFQRALITAPLSIQLSLQPIAVFSIKEGDKPEEETDPSLLYGQSEGAGSSGSAALDPATTKIQRRAGRKMKITRKNRSRKRQRNKRRWQQSVSLAVDDLPPMDEERAARIHLISEILVLLYEDDAVEIAKKLKAAEETFRANGENGEDKNLSIALAAQPQVIKRYGTKPGPGWTSGGFSRRGTQIWLWGANPGGSAPPPPTPSAPSPAPPPPPTQPPAAAAPPPPTSTAPPPTPPSPTPPAALPQPTPPAPAIPATGTAYAARFAAAVPAHQAAMNVLNAGQQLSPARKADLSKHLAVMTIPMLQQLHRALGGTFNLVGSRVAHARYIRSILSGAHSAAMPQASAPTPPAPSPTPPPTPQPAPTPTPTPQPTPTPAPPAGSPLHQGANVISGVPAAALPSSTKLPPIPYKDEHDWETGKAQPGSLNGIDFIPAPPKFWEKVKDVDIKEPPPTKKINRVGVMIQEPDGRIWIVQPTNGFGNRNYTVPGGTVEPGLTNQQNALKEVWEETGLQVEITGVAGDFKDSNNGNNGRLYIGKRVGGAPWDAKIEQSIINHKTGQPAAESEKVTLVTPEKAAKLLHRTDDVAQLWATTTMPLDTPVSGKGSGAFTKLLDALDPKIQNYIGEKRTKKEDPGVSEMHAAQELRGFNKPPKVVKKADFDSLMTKGDHIEVLRGLSDHGSSYGSTKPVSAKELAKQFRTGDHYPGSGVFGAGTYADSNKGYGNVAATTYGSGGSVIRMAIPKTAKIVKVSELEKKVPNKPNSFQVSANNGTSLENWMGVQAALAGYDAIYVDGNSTRHGTYGKGFYIILNRGIVTVQDTDVPSGYRIP